MTNPKIILGALASAVTSPYMVIAAFNNNSANPNNQGRLFESVNNAVLVNHNHSTDLLQLGAGSVISYSKSEPFSPIIGSFLVNGASGEIRENGVSKTTGSTGTTALATSGIELGNRTEENRALYGGIAELLIYDANISDIDHNLVGNYLADKYGLTWTNI